MNSWSEDNIRDKDTGETINKNVNILEETIIERQQKHIEKQNRQQLKIQCLEGALRYINNKDAKPEEVVTAAKAFYAFVRT